MPASLRPYVVLLATVSLPLYLLDQATKWAVLRWIDPEQPRVVVDRFFYLVHWYNTGAAFSMFSDSNAFFLCLSVVALAVLGVLAWRGLFPDRVSRTAWALLIAGIFGNLTDRIAHGHVVDFLLFDLHIRFANPWPAFNVADACICTAAGLFFVQSFREPRKE